MSVDMEKQEKLEPSISNTSVQDAKADSSSPFYMKVVSFLLSEAESRGIDRVPEDERTPPSIWGAASMWLAANMVIATFSLGVLATAVMGLTFYQATVTTIFFSLLGSFSVAFFSVFGAKFGLRQMVLSRFLVGNVAARIFSLINMVACVGWGAVNIISSAQLLHIVNNGALPPFAGCIILVVLTILVSFFGYKVIHYYEMYSWIPSTIVFIIIIARMKMSGNFDGTAPSHNGRFPSGSAGGVLSFGGAIYGFATGWTTYAADYTVYQPRNIKSIRTFLGVMIGLCVPLFFCSILGAACGTGIYKDQKWADAYESDSIGGLVYSILVTDSLHGFGQFCCVILALSTVANNIPNMYSIALSAQTLWSPLSKVPRIVWTMVGNFATLAICIPAYYKFASFMSNFMDLISYYLAIYTTMSLAEHFIYRRGFSGYNYLDYKDPSKIPAGYAGTFGFCCGVAGVVIGMGSTWYQGVVGRQIGPSGGELGFELGGAFAFIGYNLVRPFEIKYTGR